MSENWGFSACPDHTQGQPASGPRCRPPPPTVRCDFNCRHHAALPPTAGQSQIQRCKTLSRIRSAPARIQRTRPRAPLAFPFPLGYSFAAKNGTSYIDQRASKDDQPDARVGQAGRPGVAERFGVPRKSGNAGGMTAPVASGWSGCQVGLAPTGTRRLCAARAISRHVTNVLDCPPAA
jgi:hypothetical protein